MGALTIQWPFPFFPAGEIGVAARLTFLRPRVRVGRQI